VISYDFPLNERVRTLLRLEDLYAKLLCFIDRSTATDHQAALSVLFEILEVASRSDLKSELLQELERQKRQLSALRNNPEISEQALDTVLDEIESASSGVLNMGGKVGQHLRENEWLMSIKQRAGIPGGTCEFDLPSYHHWLQQDAMLRRNYLMKVEKPTITLPSRVTFSKCTVAAWHKCCVSVWTNLYRAFLKLVPTNTCSTFASLLPIM
jgi:cell division protein ZapD